MIDIKLIRDNPQKFIDGAKVKKVAVMAEQGWGTPDVKAYTTVVSINQATDGLKPGMSARVEVLCKVIRDKLVTPVTGMRMLRGRTAAVVKTSSGLEVREIKIGETNDKFVVIKAGLLEGDEVLLYEPKVMPKIPWAEPVKETPTIPEPVEPTPDEAAEKKPDEADKPDAAEIERLRKRLQNATAEERQRILDQLRKQRGRGRPDAQGTGRAGRPRGEGGPR